MQQLVSERKAFMHPSVCIAYVAWSCRRQQFNMSYGRENGAPEKYAFASRVKYFISHVPHARENERAVVTMKNFPCENYVTNDHKLNVIQAQTL